MEARCCKPPNRRGIWCWERCSDNKIKQGIGRGGNWGGTGLSEEVPSEQRPKDELEEPCKEPRLGLAFQAEAISSSRALKKEHVQLKKKIGADAPKTSHILNLFLWTSTTLGIVLRTTSRACWEELMRSSLSNTEQCAWHNLNVTCYCQMIINPKDTALSISKGGDDSRPITSVLEMSLKDEWVNFRHDVCLLLLSGTGHW